MHESSVSMLNIAKELLPVSAILVVLFSMAGVDILIVGEPLRAVTVVPIGLVLLLWLVATVRVRRTA